MKYIKYLISDDESKAIDILKFISIIFIIYIHSLSGIIDLTNLNNYNFEGIPYHVCYIISELISKCGVLIFYLLSFVLLFSKKRNYIETIIKKIKTLIVPYIFWNTFWIFVFIIVENVPLISHFIKDSNFAIFKSDFMGILNLYGIGTQFPKCYPLYFIRDLFFVILFYPIVKFIVFKNPKLFLILSIVMFISPINFTLKTAFLCEIAGACIVLLNVRLGSINNVPRLPLLLLYIFMLILCIIFKNDILIRIFNICSIVFLTMIVFLIIKCHYKFSLLKLASKYTFFIYVFHEYTMTIIRKIIFSILPINGGTIIICYIFIPIFTILICVIFGYTFKKYFSKIYSIVTGSR